MPKQKIPFVYGFNYFFMEFLQFLFQGNFTVYYFSCTKFFADLFKAGNFDGTDQGRNQEFAKGGA